MGAVPGALGAFVEVESAVEATTAVGHGRVVLGVARIGADRVAGSLGQILLENVEDGIEGVANTGLTAEPTDARKSDCILRRRYSLWEHIHGMKNLLPWARVICNGEVLIFRGGARVATRPVSHPLEIVIWRRKNGHYGERGEHNPGFDGEHCLVNRRSKKVNAARVCPPPLLCRFFFICSTNCV